MPIPADEKERMRGELRRMLNRKTNKNRLHLMQKNEDLYNLAMPLLSILEKKLDIQLDSIKRGFCINEVRMSAKRAANKADKYGAPPVPEVKTKKPLKQPKAIPLPPPPAVPAGVTGPLTSQLSSLPSLPPMPSLPAGMPGLASVGSLAPQGSGLQINAVLDMLGSTFGLPGGALQHQLSMQGMPPTPGAVPAAAKKEGDKVIYRQRLSPEQVEKLTKIAEDANWSLLKIPRPQRDNIATEVGISVEQFKNFFSNAKPKDKKKASAKKPEEDEAAALAAAVAFAPPILPTL